MTFSDDGKPKDKMLCHHFKKGFCKLGESCNFCHGVRICHPDSQKLFLGGLPKNITSETLVIEFRKKGYTIMNEPKVFRRFCPQVCFGSTKEAQRMLREGKISILCCSVDVRPYKARTHKEMDRQLNVNNRSVFFVGVPSFITVRYLKAELEKMGFKVTNYPQLIPKFTLATAQQAKQLIAKGALLLNGVAISVRPYKPGQCRSGMKGVV